MKAQDLLFRGKHTSRGVIVDPAVLGIATARTRVLALWQQNARLRALPDGRWLLILPDSVVLDGRNAGAALVIESGEGFVASPDVVAGQGQILLWSHGKHLGLDLQALEPIDPSTWLALPGEAMHLTPVCGPPRPALPEPMPAPPEPNLRRSARIGPLSTQARRFSSDIERLNRANRRRALSRQRRRSGSAPSSSRGGTLARLALKSPLRNEIGRQHARYIDKLSSRFSSGDLSEALHHAIPLGGLGSGGLSLRLPRRRDNLGLTGGGVGGRAVPLGPTVHQHLIALYRKAATDLEAAGRIDEAAFVLAELLNVPAECVAVLERHRRYETAATLAENRKLEPAMTVRLWWLAGNRERAMRLARKSHSYPQVLTYLANSDPQAAHSFRLAWVDELERCGNLHGAIAIGWPDPEIRPLLVNTIRRGIGADDEWSLSMRAYEVALQPSATRRAEFLNALNASTVNADELRHMATALVLAESTDPVVDREVCTAAIRALVAIPRDSPDKSFAAAFRAIRNRADPIVAADLPRSPREKRSDGSIQISARPPGVSEIRDVVPLGAERSLIALGELGVRLVTADGRTAASWPTPCHHLVPADNGKRVLLLTARDSRLDVHVLDLITRKTRFYGTIQSQKWATNFDGATWAALDQRGIAFYDLLADQPKIAWRELEAAWTCLALQRSANSLAAVVSIPDVHTFSRNRLQLWRWELPALRLDERKNIEPVDDAVRLHLLSDATSIWERNPELSMEPVVRSSTSKKALVGLAAAEALMASGDHLAIQDSHGTIDIANIHRGGVGVKWSGVAETWGFRSHGTRLSIWTESGNVSLVDLGSRTSLVEFTIT